jgi:hypothetical protein
MNIQPLIDRWQTNEGKPYKGRLIDMDAYDADPTNPGCMDAQGQVLHYAGWDADQLNHAVQKEADREVAKLLNISNSHAILLRIINDAADGAPATVLTDPGAVLGDQWSKVLDLWWYLDAMSFAASQVARGAGWATAWEASRRSSWEASRRSSWEASAVAASQVARGAGWATAWAASWEIQGAEIMRRDGKPFYFLPSFGFASPDDIPVRPADYGPFTGE